MKTIEIGPDKIKVVIYDSIHNIPPNRESLMAYYQLSEMGIGHDWGAIDSHLNGLLMAANQNDLPSLYQEIENLRLCYYTMASKYNPEHISWMCLIESVDGKPIDTSEDALRELSEALGEHASDHEFLWAQCFEEVKKKFPTSWQHSCQNGIPEAEAWP